MGGVRVAASRGLRWGVLGLAALIAFTAMATDPADARARRKRAVAVKYNPPYAAIVVDANSGKTLHASNADSLRHPASLTKIMTLYLLFERMEAGKLRPDSALKVSSYAAGQAPSKLGLRAGQTIEVDAAIKALVTKSANDVAVIVAEALAADEDEFAALMTKKARALGMKRTVYRNASGLPDSEQVTTAREQAILARAIQDRFPRHYKYFATKSFSYRGRAMRNHNRLLGQVAGVDGIKTGYTRASGFNLITSVRRSDRHVVAVILGGRSGAARDGRMRELIGKHVMLASTRRTAPAIAEAATPVRTVAATRANARTARATAPAAAGAPLALAPDTATAPTAAGSVDPIRPNLVKTVTVRAGSLKSSTLPAPAEQPFMTNPHVYAAAGGPPTRDAVAPATTEPASPPPAPAGARPGVLGVLKITTGSAAETAPPRAPAPAPAPEASRPKQRSGWMIQVGAFPGEDEAREHLNSAKTTAARLLRQAEPFTERIVRGDKALYRARFAGLEKHQAEAACRTLKENDFDCMTIRN